MFNRKQIADILWSMKGFFSIIVIVGICQCEIDKTYYRHDEMIIIFKKLLWNLAIMVSVSQ